MKRIKDLLVIVAIGIVGFLLVSCGENSSTKNNAKNKETITVYSSLENDEIHAYLADFKVKNPDIEVNIIRDSTGIVTAKLLAENVNTPADVIWGTGAGTVLSCLQYDMIEPYKPVGFDRILPQFRDKNTENPKWVGIKATMTSFICNEKEMGKLGVTAPKSYQDLLNPKFKNQITNSNPASSGTGFLFVSSILQNMGEEEGWKFLDKLNENIFMYTHSGSMPAKQAAAGESAIGISFGYCGVLQKRKGAPIINSFPSEKSGWDVESNLLIKKANIKSGAKKFLDWAISDSAMKLYAENFAIITDGRKVTVDKTCYPENPYTHLAKNDLEWAASNRARILKEWSARYDSKSQKK